MGTIPPISLLSEAIQLSDRDTVNIFAGLKSIINNTYQGPEYVTTTALHHAISLDRTYIVQWLLDNGAEYNSLDGTERTPLHLAAQMGHLDIVNKLLGAAKSATMIGGTQPSVAQYVNTKDKNGQTAIFFADTLEIATILIDAGADTSIADANNFSPFKFSCAVGVASLLQWLEAQKLAISKQDLHICLINAIARDRGHDVQWLLGRKDLDLNSPYVRASTLWEQANPGSHASMAALVLKDRENQTMNTLFNWSQAKYFGKFRIWRFDISSVCLDQSRNVPTANRTVETWNTCIDLGSDSEREN